MLTTTLDAPYALGHREVELFNRDGFVRLKDVLSEETIAVYEPEITGKVIQLNIMHLPMEQHSTYQKAFLQVENLWRHSETVREFVFSRRLARIAAELLSVPAVRLYHDQALYKEADGGITPWHADQYYWPLASDRCCTVWVPLQETSAAMGPLAFAAGSHGFSYGRDLPISDESEAALQAAFAGQDFPVVAEPYALDEVSYHLGWTFHHATPNSTATPRRVMTVIYIDADIRIAEPVNDPQRIDLATCMPGARPGDVPDTELNPVLYQTRPADFSTRKEALHDRLLHDSPE